MKKTLKLTLLLGGLALACVGVGCNELTPVEKNKESGYSISVTYDANGGSFLNRPGITVMDMFNPSNYEEDANGVVHIKLTEPTDPSRPSGGSDPITLTLQNHFFAGWYQNREVKTVDGKPVDEAGKELKKLDDGTYVYADTVNDEKPTAATPAYSYSGYWDFENDTIDYKDGDTVEMRLYAGWVPYYEFHYYQKVNGQWSQVDAVTKFDYKVANTIEEHADKDTIYLPQWQNGAMNYTSAYSNGEKFEFPMVADTTFEMAYSDMACTQPIIDSFEHQGSLNPDSGENGALVVENRIQNIYLSLSEGVQYRIERPDQLITHKDPKGYYEFAGDMNFTGLVWPIELAAGEFSGKMYGKDGKAVTLSNINVEYSSDKAYGGLFGKVTKTASMQNITFTNVNVNFIKTGKMQGSQYGLFAGDVEEGANLSVAIDGRIQVGMITNASDLEFHLVTNGSLAGITAGNIGLEIYGEPYETQYDYTVEKAEIKDGKITFTFYPSSALRDQEKYIIQ